jgi:ABC-type sugar transport system ATPase subunit
MAETLLELRNIIVHHEERVVLGVPSLDVHRGEVLAIIGPNGAGKSTLLRVMGVLQRPDDGTVFFRGENALNGDPLRLRRRIANVFQEPLLLNASVHDNAALGLKLRHTNPVEIERRLQPWLERLGISGLAARKVRTLSGGEAQRTSLARALVLDPELLLLDEPFSALDQPTRDALLEDLQEILRETGTTTVFVTHDRDEAFRLADRVGMMSGGALLQVGPTSEVFACPVTDDAAEIAGIENKIHGVVENVKGKVAVVRIEGGKIYVPARSKPGARVALYIRADNITVSPLNEKSALMDAPNTLKATVSKVSAGISDYQLTVRFGKTLLMARAERKNLFDFRPCVGADVKVSFSAAAVHVIEVSNTTEEAPLQRVPSHNY